MTTDDGYLSCTETAKLIRTTLKRKFPGTKFSVKSSSYSGGASIDVTWEDGPTDAAVSAVTDAYAGRGFDGSIDLAYSCQSWLYEDGSASFAYTAGTGESRGSNPEVIGSPTHGSGRLVHFGANYVHTHRELSANLISHCAQFVTDNGRDSHGGQCQGCGDWPHTDTRWVVQYTDAHGTERTDFTCSQLCAGRRLARFTDAGAAVAS